MLYGGKYHIIERKSIKKVWSWMDLYEIFGLLRFFVIEISNDRGDLFPIFFSRKLCRMIGDNPRMNMKGIQKYTENEYFRMSFDHNPESSSSHSTGKTITRGCYFWPNKIWKRLYTWRYMHILSSFYKNSWYMITCHLYYLFTIKFSYVNFFSRSKALTFTWKISFKYFTWPKITVPRTNNRVQPTPVTEDLDRFIPLELID